jgi:hypothetical protein
VEVILPSHASIAVTTLVPGHGDVLKGKTFVRQEIALSEAVVAAMNEEIGRSSSESQKRFEPIKKAVRAADNPGIGPSEDHKRVSRYQSRRHSSDFRY